MTNEQVEAVRNAIKNALLACCDDEGMGGVRYPQAEMTGDDVIYLDGEFGLEHIARAAISAYEATLPVIAGPTDDGWNSCAARANGGTESGA